LIARNVARYANSGRNLSQTMTYAQTVCHKCDELVFLDQLKFLAAGGRITKANGFFGDLLRIKPVIRPSAAGAQKVAVVRSQRAQVEFALDYLRKTLSADAPVQVLLQYTDNLDWVRSHIQSQIQALLPLARISVTAMSLTSGVHMGPGTWSVAFLPGDIDSSE
jgi:DegV family protein with EDD domain